MKPLDVRKLSVEQKIGQMLLCRRPRNEADKAFILELIRNRSLGGIHLNAYLKDVDDYLAAADYPLLICDNMECGYEHADAVSLPSPLAVAAVGSEQAAYNFARISAIDAKSHGRNCVFGPILDIAMNPRSACVGPRTFGGDAGLVSRLSAAAVRGYQDEGMVVTAKHYPGFGESATDSHIGMVYLEGDENLLVSRELVPYLRCIREADLSGVMVGHIMVPKIDPDLPASLSPKLIGLLRKIGFDGLVMTDSLAMVGLTNLFGLEACHRLAMAAGNDMVMTSYRLSAKDAYEYMLATHRGGHVTMEQIDAAVRRVAAAQARTLRRPSAGKTTDADRRIAAAMCEQAVVRITEDGVKPLSPGGRHLFLVQTGNNFTDPQTGKNESEGSTVDGLVDCLRKNFPASEIRRVNDFPSARQIEHACAAAMDFDSVAAVCFARTEYYMGSSDLTARFLAMLEGMGTKLKAVVLFGNPYAARHLPKAGQILLGFSGTQCEEAAIKVLAGELAPRGRVPVPLQLHTPQT